MWSIFYICCLFTEMHISKEYFSFRKVQKIKIKYSASLGLPLPALPSLPRYPCPNLEGWIPSSLNYYGNSSTHKTFGDICKKCLWHFQLVKINETRKNIAKLGENESLKNWTPKLWYNISICLWQYANKIKQSPLGSHKQDVCYKKFTELKIRKDLSFIQSPTRHFRDFQFPSVTPLLTPSHFFQSGIL